MLPLLIASLFAACTGAIPTIHTKGSKFFTSDGNQWFVKGVAYQLVPDDPLIDTAQCKRDAALLQELGANSLRVYHVDPDANHQGCMTAFNDVGIYLFIDLDTFDTQIEQTAPRWNQSQVTAFQKVMDAFHTFDNVAGFFVGNEVLTTGEGSQAAPFIKAAARDMKAYRNSKGYRNIPIGYSAADIATTRPMLQNYLSCGTNSSEALDFFSLNAYEWCGQTTYEVSGYRELTAMITSYNIPIFFSETGCITQRPRTFDDQVAIFGSQMAPYWSGSIVYEWIQEANDYGLIKYGEKVDPASPSAPPDGFTRSGTPTPISPDFPNLSRHWKTLSPSSVKEADYTPTLTAPPCPDLTAGAWEVQRNVPLPTIGASLDDNLKSVIAGKQPAPTTSGGVNNNGPQPTKPAGSVAASPAREVKGMGIALMTVLIGVFWWL